MVSRAAQRRTRNRPDEYVTRRNRMAKNPHSESMDETAFQALEDALKIDFNDEPEPRAAPRGKSSPSPQEAPVPETPKRVRQHRSKRVQGVPLVHTKMPPRPKRVRTRSSQIACLCPANDSGRATHQASCAHWKAGRCARLCATPPLFPFSGPSAPWAGAASFRQRSLGCGFNGRCGLETGILAMVVGIIVPIMLFFAFAIMMARAQDLRNAARSITEVACAWLNRKQLRPNASCLSARPSVANVSAMNEGIERTIARATELETLVHSEVSALNAAMRITNCAYAGLCMSWAASEMPSSITRNEFVHPSSALMIS